MNKKLEMKILELKINVFSNKFCKVDMLIETILTIISIVVLYKSGFIISIFVSYFIRYFYKKFFKNKVDEIKGVVN